MALEYECKLQATPEALDAIQAAFPGSWALTPMETAYYGDADGVLARRKWTLRRRMEGGAPVCALKTPAGPARNEWEVPCDSILEAIPLLIAAGAPEELADLAREVQVLCGARFTRRSLVLSRGGALLELALDAGALFAGDRSEALAEVEVERKAGDAAQADALARELARTYGLTVQPSSKFARALALRRNENAQA